MNCAAVTITGGSGSGLGSLPDMFVANVGNGCTSNLEPSGDLEFPNPGEDVDRNSSKSAPPVGTCQAPAGKGSGGDVISKPEPTSPAGPEPTAEATAPAATKTFDDGLYHPSTTLATAAVTTSLDDKPSAPPKVESQEYEIVMVIDGKTQTGKAYLSKPTGVARRNNIRGRSQKYW